MGIIVIAAYRPKPGKSGSLKALMKTHLHVLRSEELVTDREPITMESADGTIVEVFEWKSREAIEQAHANPRVLEMWQAYDAASDFVPVAEVAEAKTMFSEFRPLETVS